MKQTTAVSWTVNACGRGKRAKFETRRQSVSQSVSHAETGQATGETKHEFMVQITKERTRIFIYPLKSLSELATPQPRDFNILKALHAAPSPGGVMETASSDPMQGGLI